MDVGSKRRLASPLRETNSKLKFLAVARTTDVDNGDADGCCCCWSRAVTL